MGDYGGVKRRRERCENLTAPVPIRFLYSQLAIYECTGQRVPYEHLCSRALAACLLSAFARLATAAITIA
ncbi:MAG: hypothetical protein DME39_05580 [Verrucomicrobia bacterium]|nr:MAG: hypothetical protein DME39_05580 [Verrucomicrobiota bacterium]